MMWVWWILGIVAVAICIRCAVGSCSGSGCKTCKTGSALDALKSRYAKGEISRDDFERMKRDVE